MARRANTGTCVDFEQYGAHMKAQEEQRAAASTSAAAGHGSPFFTL
ncbi:hypothetical protein A2U01_0091460, partial [Trifolium medium]|nr:hypothetical protein [Trifolium medium]